MIAKTQREVMDLLRKTVRPEFLNRVDELIMFRPLSQRDPAWAGQAVREIVKRTAHPAEQAGGKGHRAVVRRR